MFSIEESNFVMPRRMTKNTTTMERPGPSAAENPQYFNQLRSSQNFQGRHQTVALKKSMDSMKSPSHKSTVRRSDATSSLYSADFQKDPPDLYKDLNSSCSNDDESSMI